MSWINFSDKIVILSLFHLAHFIWIDLFSISISVTFKSITSETLNQLQYANFKISLCFILYVFSLILKFHF